MTNDKSQQPRETDAVLGAVANPPAISPVSSLVLGGLEGFKRRLGSSVAIAQGIDPSEALNYGQEGIDLLLKNLEQGTPELRRSIYNLLRYRTDLKIRQAISEHTPYQLFECLLTIDVQFDKVNAIGFSSDGQTLCCTNSRKRMQGWDVQTGDRVTPPSIPLARVNAIALNPTKKILIMGSYKRIKILDWRTEREVRTLTGHASYVSAVASSLNGEILVSGGWDKTIKVWQLSTGKSIHTLVGHSDSIDCVAISPDGQAIASSSRDRLIKIWGIP